LTLWKGHLSFRQYILLKAAKFSIKSLDLNESSMGCVWYFCIYTEHVAELTNHYVTVDTNKTSAIVVKFVEHLDHGHTLWLDKFYNFKSRLDSSNPKA
jgi:hypothetical protein